MVYTTLSPYIPSRHYLHIPSSVNSYVLAKQKWEDIFIRKMLNTIYSIFFEGFKFRNFDLIHEIWIREHIG